MSATRLVPEPVRAWYQPVNVTLLLQVMLPLDGKVSKFCVYVVPSVVSATCADAGSAAKASRLQMAKARACGHRPEFMAHYPLKSVDEAASSARRHGADSDGRPTAAWYAAATCR